MEIKYKFKSWSGWIVAAGFGAVMFASGFQAGAEKTGVVDLNTVIQQSNYGKSSTESLNNQLKVRRALIDFVMTYKVLTREQAERLRELSLKAPQTEDDKKQVEKIKADVMESDRRRNELSQKANLTEADAALLRDYSQRALAMEELVNRWSQIFQEDLEDLQTKAREDSITKAKAALSAVAKAGAYTVVMESTVAPFGVNDLTEAVVTKMNATK
ncbi:MAG: OmpH family outer membrane protein [Chthonomonas sp.]|nr:OmpH family outer membrane protein [Chthonomonas sp.]